MDSSPHPVFPELLATFERNFEKALPWGGVVFRSVDPRHASPLEALSGRGSLAIGGRWNAPRSFAAVYTSLDPETAMAEALARVRGEGLPDHIAMPRLFFALHVRLERTIDLADSEHLRALSTSRRELESCDWRRDQEAGREALTQSIGRAAFQAGLDGILVPSAGNPGGLNLVILPGNLGEGCWIRSLGS